MKAAVARPAPELPLASSAYTGTTESSNWKPKRAAKATRVSRTTGRVNKTSRSGAPVVRACPFTPLTLPARTASFPDEDCARYMIGWITRGRGRGTSGAVDSRFRGNDGNAKGKGVGVALVQVLRRIRTLMPAPEAAVRMWAVREPPTYEPL